MQACFGRREEGGGRRKDKELIAPRATTAASGIRPKHYHALSLANTAPIVPNSVCSSSRLHFTLGCILHHSVNKHLI